MKPSRILQLCGAGLVVALLSANVRGDLRMPADAVALCKPACATAGWPAPFVIANTHIPLSAAPPLFGAVSGDTSLRPVAFIATLVFWSFAAWALVETMRWAGRPD